MENNGTESLVNKLTAYMSTKVPVNTEEVKSELSEIVTKFHIAKVEEEEAHPDLLGNVDLFISTKALEGSSVNTVNNYRLQLNKMAEHIRKHTKDITPSDIRGYLSLYSHQKTSTVQTKASIIKSFFGWLSLEEVIEKDPSKRVKVPKSTENVSKSLSIAELEHLRESCGTRRQRALIEVLYSTGARISEIIQLNISDIDFSERSVSVYGKGGKTRKVFFSHKALFHLQRYLSERKDDNDALFVTLRSPNERVTTRSVQREVGHISSESGIKKNVTPHTFRHTFATLTLNGGADIAAVQSLLGHSSPDTTLRYATVSDNMRKQQHNRHLIQ